MHTNYLLIGAVAAFILTGCREPAQNAAVTQTSPTSSNLSTNQWPGRQPDGSVVLPNQWSLRPAGQQVPLTNFPVNVAIHPSGKYAAVLHAGYGKHAILVVDIAKAQVVSHTPVNETFYGIEFFSDGTQVVCSGAGDELVHVYGFQNGNLTPARDIKLRDPKQRGVPAGIALDRDAHRLYVANVWGDRVTVASLTDATKPVDIFLSAQGATNFGALVQASSDAEVLAAEKRAQAALIETGREDAFPYACRLDERRNRLYVSLWAQSSVAVIDLSSNQLIARWPSEEHPCEMALTRSGKVLFVANANRNTVTVFDTTTGKVLETIWAAFVPQSPPGATPNSLALSPDEQTLYVANANVNAVAVFDVKTPGKTRSLGFIPVGWYPTSVRVTPDGKRLLVANAKGLSSKANPNGPMPGVPNLRRKTEEYIGGLLQGDLSIIELPRKGQMEKQMAQWTAQANQCVPSKDRNDLATRSTNNPIPARLGESSPIKYCLYIIKENRTYDQLLGDIPQGNGDTRLCIFPERVTPNHHKLARDFVLLDNFYADAEVSAGGHEWSMGAYATDFVEKTWPLSYGHDRSGKYPYPSEGNLPIAAPAGGYLWDRAKQAGVTYRSYGEFINNGKTTNDPAFTRVKTLQGHFDERFRGFDLGYSDLKRADRFISELHRFESEGAMPRLQILRLPNDHTHGTTKGFLTPTAFVAENDVALGRVIDAVTHSRFWPQTAIFVVEDDAQNGSDHVDAHRTVALVVSPYTKRNVVDSTLYSASSMLRTMELILGLQPMSQFDAAARPMFNCFQASADLRPYEAMPAQVDLQEKNMPTAWGSELKGDFSKEDAVDDLQLNEVVWRSVRGANSPMPAPVRAAFVRAHGEEVDRD